MTTPPPARPAGPPDPEAEKIAEAFHEAYEQLSWKYGYNLRPRYEAWDQAPPQRRAMRIEVARQLLDAGVVHVGPAARERVP